MTLVQEVIWATTFATVRLQRVQSGCTETEAARAATVEANSAIDGHRYAERNEDKWQRESGVPGRYKVPA